MKIRLGLTLLALGIFLPPAATAARIVNSGYIVHNSFGAEGYDMSGDDFRVTGGTYEGVWAQDNCVICLPGTAVSINGGVGGGDLSAGTGTIGGVTTIVGWQYTSFFSVAGPSIVVNGGGVYHGTFTLTGQFCGTTLPPPPLNCVVDVGAVTGHGTVQMTVYEDPFNGRLQVTSTTYQFVPEPSTVSLMLMPLAFLMMRRRKRHAGRPNPAGLHSFNPDRRFSPQATAP